MILFSMMTMAIFYNNVLAALPLECDPSFLDDLPPRIRKICTALSKAYELGSGVGSYTNDRESHIPGVLGKFPAVFLAIFAALLAYNFLNMIYYFIINISEY